MCGNKGSISALRRVRSFALRTSRRATNRLQVTIDGSRVESSTGLGRCVLGDAQDLGEEGGFLGNGVLLEMDNVAGSLTLTSSITGLPPVYFCDCEGQVLFASGVKPLLDSPRLNRRLDGKTVRALARGGRPPPGRTLFEGIRQVEPGTQLRIHPTGVVEELGKFCIPALDFEEEEQFVLEQIAAFRSAVSRLELEGAVLSLTAGLDSRAILAILAKEGRWIDAATICGERPAIDVIRASQLARECGFRHTVVRLDDKYRAMLPDLCEQASRFSQGLRSFDETPDLYLYRCLSGRYRARLSGLLGNQVGRSGTEGISTRGADFSILAPWLREGDESANTHWMLDAAAGRPLGDPAFLIQVESCCSSQANYMVGFSEATQLCPYADRTLITRKIARGTSSSQNSLRSIRIRDVTHRFLGTPSRKSFQRQIIAERPGPLSRIPINYGWRARGAPSVQGVALGIGAFLDLSLGAIARRVPAARSLRYWMRVDELAGFNHAPYLYRGLMPEFVKDIFASADVRQSGLFDNNVLDAVVRTGLRDRIHHATIVFALDLALAYRNFVSRTTK